MIRRPERNATITFAVAVLMFTVLVGCMQPPAETAPPMENGVPSIPPGMVVRPEALPEPAAMDFEPPQPYTTTLPNGIKLFILENHELPLVNISVLIGNGSRIETVAQKGTANYTANIMRRGGSVNLQGDALDDTLDFLGANLSVRMGEEAATANLNVLKEHLDTGLSIFADVLMNPAFPIDKIEEQKRINRGGIQRRDDDPYQIGRRKFRQIVYGTDNPWAQQMEIEDINRITRDELVAFHKTWFRPNITMMAISGDVNTDEIVAKLRAEFADWESGDIPDIVLPPVSAGREPGVYIYPKDVSQAAIRLGGKGMVRHSEDQYAVEVMNRIFGAGTFTSRLGVEVRSNRGLAYYVYGAVFEDPDPRQGMALALAGTRIDKAAETIEVSRAIIDSMDTQPVTDEELASAKDQIVNSFVFEFAKPAQIVSRQMWMEYQGYADDYLDTYMERILGVSEADVHRVAAKYLKPDDLRILVVGNPDLLREPLSAFGSVTVLEADLIGSTE
jgi:zinc protease